MANSNSGITSPGASVAPVGFGIIKLPDLTISVVKFFKNLMSVGSFSLQGLGF